MNGTCLPHPLLPFASPLRPPLLPRLTPVASFGLVRFFDHWVENKPHRIVPIIPLTAVSSRLGGAESHMSKAHVERAGLEAFLGAAVEEPCLFGG